MNILKYIFTDKDLREYYHDAEELYDVRTEFEHYVFSIYEKVSIIVEIKNKFYDIEFRNKGYIAEDEKKFEKEKRFDDNLKILKEKDKALFYFKRWVNRKLKRIIKILNLEIKSKYGIINEERDIEKCIKDLKKHFTELDKNKDIKSLKMFLKLLEELEENIKKQKKEIKSIYPVKEWSLEKHKTLISDDLLKLIKEEIKLIFKKDIYSDNYNNFPAIISRAVHEHKIPEESILNNLIMNMISKIKTKKEELKIKKIKCYHARPIYVHGNVFPLDTKDKGAGFFVDMDKKETIEVIKKIYGLKENEIELFKLEIPRNLFKYAITDRFGEYKFKLDHSYIFRPTHFPLLNEFYMKKLIEIEK